MRITFVLPFAGVAGGNIVVAIYARLLKARGHDVFVVSQPAPENHGLRTRIKRWLGRAVPPPPVRLTMLDFLGDAHHVLDSARPVTAQDVPEADIVVATWWRTAEWVAELPPSRGRKFYLLQGYEVFPHLPVDRVIATYQMPLTKIAVSDYIRREIETRHGAKDIAVVPNGVDLEHFRFVPRAPSSPCTIGFLYTLAQVKNIALAIEAIDLAKARYPGLRAKVFGKNPPAPDLPIPDWVEYHRNPPQDRIPALYAACDAWLFTSEKEGFGLPLLEAMASGTPVLATRAGAAPDLVVDGQNGWLLDGTPEAFADAILRVAALSPEDWQSCSAAARRTAEAHDWETATDRLLACFTAG